MESHPWQYWAVKDELAANEEYRQTHQMEEISRSTNAMRGREPIAD